MKNIDTRTVLERTLAHAEGYLRKLQTAPVTASAPVEAVVARLGPSLPERGRDPSQVIDELVEATGGGLIGSTSGRFFAWVIGGSSEAALAADWLTATWDQNAVLSACSPAATAVEEVAGAWLLDLLALPPTASFAFTTGCQMAHVTCLAAARTAQLRRQGWDVEEEGLFSAPRIRVITSELRHASVDRALRLLGLGSKATTLPTGADGAIDPEAVRQALARPGPAIVVLGAGDINIAAFDDFAAVIPIAHEAGAWVHVDGAFGLFARASASKRGLTSGIEAADSWATDTHKWLNVPVDGGLAVVRDSSSHRTAMTARASYITASSRAREPLDWTPEWSRRARGFAVYAALRELGREGVADLVDRSCRHAEALVRGIGQLQGAEVIARPRLNQGLVRFLASRATSEADHDRCTETVIEAINASGEAFFSGTTWRGRRAMRISVVNWRTSPADIERAIVACGAAIARAAEEAR